MKLDNCHKCGTQGKTTKNEFTGDTYFAYCPKCEYFIEGVTRHDAVKDYNYLNREANNAKKKEE